jgi:hypothetical protein
MGSRCAGSGDKGGITMCCESLPWGVSGRVAVGGDRGANQRRPRRSHSASTNCFAGRRLSGAGRSELGRWTDRRHAAP